MALTVYPPLVQVADTDGAVRSVPAVVEDEDGFTIPASGKSVTLSDFYEGLLREGKLLTRDPSEGG